MLTGRYPAAARAMLRALPGARQLRFARMAGSSIAGPDAAAWVSDFLNAAYYARPAAERDVADLRLAFGVLTTRWERIDRRLRLHDVLAFHRAFGAARISAGGRLSADSLLAGAARLHGDWFPGAWADPRRRGWGIAFPTAAEREAFAPERRLRAAALGPLTPPRAPAHEQRWSTYPPVRAPSAAAVAAALADPARWPDFGSALGRFTALRAGGLAGQTFEIEVIAQPLARTPVFTRAYVTATRLLEEPGAIAAALEEAAEHLPEPPLPAGAEGRLLLELTTHEGHFLGPAISRIVHYETREGAFLRDVGSWEPLEWHLEQAFRRAGKQAQHAFWGGGRPEESMLHQVALAAG